MTKMKSRSAAKKRFKKIGNGGFKRAKGYRRHLLTKKNSKVKRQLRKTAYICDADLPTVRLLLPY